MYYIKSLRFASHLKFPMLFSNCGLTQHKLNLEEFAWYFFMILSRISRDYRNNLGLSLSPQGSFCNDAHHLDAMCVTLYYVLFSSCNANTVVLLLLLVFRMYIVNFFLQQCIHVPSTLISSPQPTFMLAV